MTTVGDVVLECRDVCTRYGSTTVLENVSTEVRAGEVHAFVGLNGAGKTTLMRLFLGMIEPDDGIVRVRGLAPASMPARHWTGVGHLVETPLLYPELTVVQNLRIAGRLAGLSAAGATAAATGGSRNSSWPGGRGPVPGNCPSATGSDWGWPRH